MKKKWYLSSTNEKKIPVPLGERERINLKFNDFTYEQVNNFKRLGENVNGLNDTRRELNKIVAKVNKSTVIPSGSYLIV